MTDNVARITEIPRGPGGLFAKGNPGRPKGAKAKASRDALKRIKELGPKAMDALTDAVANGERWAVEFVLSKILPVGRSIEFEGTSVEDVTEALRDGEISAAEAKDVAAALAKLAEVNSIDQLRERLSALEAQIGGVDR